MNGLVWNPDPVLFQLGPLAIRSYSLLMTGGIFIGYLWLKKSLLKEKISALDIDRLFVRLVLGLFLGARLVHCLFYDPGYYLSHPLEILLPIQWGANGVQFSGFSGLASHGGVIGLLATGLWWCRSQSRQLVWLLDHLAFIAPLIAAMIRLGNFFNSEIVGIPSRLPWAVQFTHIDTIPRHPVQLYESLAYLSLFLLLIPMKMTILKKKGQASGIVLTVIFCTRILLESFKTAQEEYISHLPVSMGQLLSLPFVLMGLWLWIRASRKKTEESCSKPSHS